MSKDHFFSVDIIDVNNDDDDNNNIEVQKKAEFGVTLISKEDISKLFSGRNLVFIATLSKDNSPHVTPVWADMDEKEELVLINSFEGPAKVRNVRRDPRVALSIVETHNTYKMVSMKGKVVDVTMNDADNHLHKLAKKYLGIGKYYYRKPSHKRVIIKVKPEKIMGISIHPAFYFLAYSP
jgi:PPOX class probable F420-dependent enzyme